MVNNIYELIDPIDGQTRYIGKAIDISGRWNA